MTVDRIWCDPNCNSFYQSFDESPDCTTYEMVCCIRELYMQAIKGRSRSVHGWVVTMWIICVKQQADEWGMVVWRYGVRWLGGYQWFRDESDKKKKKKWKIKQIISKTFQLKTDSQKCIVI